jgi:hypothetical protein
MDSKYMPLMMMMTMPAQNRTEVTQAVMTNMLPLGQTQRTVFAAMTANTQADNHRVAVQAAERDTGDEVIEFLGEAAEAGTFDVSEETLAKYPRVSRYALDAKIKSRFEQIDFLPVFPGRFKKTARSAEGSPAHDQFMEAFRIAYDKQSGSLNQGDRDRVPLIKAVFEEDPELEKNFEKVVREVRRVAKARSEEK